MKTLREILGFFFPNRINEPCSVFTTFIPFPNKPWFLRVCSTSLLKTLWEKEKFLVSSNFSFSHIIFYPFYRTFFFHQIWNCRLQTLSVWKSLITLKFLKITNMYSFSVMSSLDDVFEASSVYFQYVNEQAAYVKIDRVSRRCRPGP